MNDAVTEVMDNAVADVTNAVGDAVPTDVTEKIGFVERYLNELPQKALNLGIRVVLALVFFFVGVQVIKLIRRIVKKSLKRANADLGVIQFLDSLIKAILYMILLFMIASGFGLDATSVVAVVGSAGVALGLALQGSLSNFAGGVLILLLKPFRVGDYIIEDNKGNEGTVKEIQLFYTKLLTPDDKVIILPNGTLANTSLTNVTDKDYRQLDLKVDIAYEADLRLAKKLLQELVKNDPSVIQSMEHNVFVNELGSSSVVLGVRAWVKSEEYWPTRWRMLENIKLTLDENHIDIPYQQITVHQAHMESEK